MKYSPTPKALKTSNKNLEKEAMSAPTSLADLKSGNSVPGDKDESPDKTIDRISKPIWYDEDRYMRGQEFFTKHRCSIMFSYLCAIMVGFTVDQLTNALIFTGLSVGPKKARRRYMHTLDLLIKWHTGGDVFDPESVAGSSVLRVRHMHHYARSAMMRKNQEHLETNPEGTAPLLPDGVLPMNQYDMALVQSGFIGPMLLLPELIGIKATTKEFDDYAYFWRVLGWCLGLRYEYNMCGTNAQIVKKISEEVQDEIIVPGLRNPSPHFIQLSGDFVKGMSVAIPISQPGLYKFLFPGMGLKPPTLTVPQWMYYALVVATSWLCYNVLFMRWFLNLFFKYVCHDCHCHAHQNQLTFPKQPEKSTYPT